MELEIVKELENIIEKEGTKLKDDPALAAFEQATIEFNKLVESGMVKRRGYTLMTIEGKHLQQFAYSSNLSR